MKQRSALALVFLTGYISLSCELIWYRAFAFALAGRQVAFSLVLGMYLLGLALGSFMARRFCARSAASQSLRLWRMGAIVLAFSLLSYAVLPLTGLWLESKSWRWLAPGLIALASAGFGAVFPMASHDTIPTDRRAGTRVSVMYLSSILGATAGPILTGLVLMDRVPLPAIVFGLSLLGITMSAALMAAAANCGGRPAWRPAATVLLVAVALAWTRGPFFDGLYERLLFKTDYRPGRRLAHVVETSEGVIAVTAEGVVYGGGVYDGVYNTDLRKDPTGLARPYAIGAFHPAPADVLVIGLGSGSWAQIIANHPHVRQVTVVEINRGYLGLLPSYPDVAALPLNAKVRIEVGDVRGWLTRHEDARFDMVVANAAYHWRANATNVLSEEFLELVRQHLKPGGVYAYNTTGGARAQRTGAALFPFAWLFNNLLVVSDAPLQPDFDRLRSQLATYRLDGRPALNGDDDADRRLIEDVVNEIGGGLESRAAILARTAGLALVTDDNMGTEWPWRPWSLTPPPD